VKALLSLIRVFLFPIIVINIFGDIVSGIWLGFAGQWWALKYGIVSLIVSSFVLPIFLLPSLPFSMLGNHFEGRGLKFVSMFFYFMSSFYVVCLITAWCTGVLHYFLSKVGPSPIVPTLLWSYGIATGPWAYIAQKEGADSTGSCVGLVFASLGYLFMIAMVLFFTTSLVSLLLAMGTVMALGLLFQFKLAISMDKTVDV